MSRVERKSEKFKQPWSSIRDFRVHISKDIEIMSFQPGIRLSTILSFTQWTQKRYQKDIQFWTSNCSEDPKWQHLPLPITSKSH